MRQMGKQYSSGLNRNSQVKKAIAIDKKIIIWFYSFLEDFFLFLVGTRFTMRLKN